MMKIIALEWPAVLAGAYWITFGIVRPWLKANEKSLPYIIDLQTGGRYWMKTVTGSVNGVADSADRKRMGICTPLRAPPSE